MDSVLSSSLARRAAGALPTATFVLLWSSGALFAKWGLAHASPFLFLALRLALALAVVSALAWRRGRWWPRPGTARPVAAAGLLLVGAYSACYLLALAHGMTPGLLATWLGAQPLLSLLLTERPLSRRRLVGLGCALAGLTLVAWESLVAARVGWAGLAAASGALVAITWGTLLQKRLDQAPLDVLPLQYAVGLLPCLLLLPFEQVQATPGLALAASVGWLALVISVAATLLLYRLLQAGNLVNVTSLFYLVPPGTALLDALVFGTRLPMLAWGGMGAIVLGLALVFRKA